MKAITLKQPWASLLFTPIYGDMGELLKLGLKTLETRTWKTDYRGELLITTSKKPFTKYWPLSHVCGICRYCGCTDNHACADGCSWVDPGYRDICSTCQKLELNGYAIGVVELTDVFEYSEEYLDEGCCLHYPKAQAFKFENPWPIRPIPIKGKLGIWEAPYARHNLSFVKKPIHPDWYESDLPF